MALAKACRIFLFTCILSQSLLTTYSIKVSGDDPWYTKASFYWPFNTLQDKGIVDQRGGSSVLAQSKNGLQLDGLLGSWADLGNCSHFCMNDPSACETGFTVTFWLLVNEKQRDGIVLQIGANHVAVGTTAYIKNDAFGVFVNSRAIQRNVQVKWTYSRWVFVAVFWNKSKNAVDITLDCKAVPYTKNSVETSYQFEKIPPYSTLILGATNARLKSIKMTVDELALWNGVLSEEDVCYIMQSKAVDGNFTDWNNFTWCSVSCGQGARTRSRTCTNPRPKHGGNDCIGNHSETGRCFLRHCPIDGNYSDWSDFSSCSLSCGGGQRYRNRTCSRPRPQYDGMNCSALGPAIELEECNTHRCPIHGGYSEWSNFSQCSVSCGNGSHTRRRSCDNPTPQYGGEGCSLLGAANETRLCFIKVCPADGNYSDWSIFGACSKTCGGGQRRRNRTCDNPAPQGEGRNCSRLGKPFEFQPCNIQPCPVHGGYTPWSEFSLCTKSCGGGTRARTRNCTNPPAEDGGQDCKRLGSPRDTRSCNIHYCPVNGGYGQWSSFTQCSQTCGSGQMVRTRNCDDPLPEYGGRNCSHLGPSRDSIPCNTQRCPNIYFMSTVTFPEERYHQDILNKQSRMFQRMVAKIKYNIRRIYDENSALETIEVKYCGSEGGPVVVCVINFGFLDELYTDVIPLQDALIWKELIYTLPVKNAYLSSNDVPSNAPGNVTAHNSSSRSIKVTWIEVIPREFKVGDILGYRVQYIDEKGRTWNRLVPAKEKTHVELTKLQVYTMYCVQVMAYNNRGDGVASSPVCAYTDADVPDRAPSNVTVRNMSFSELLVSWEHMPSKLVHGVLLSYRLKYKAENSNKSQLVSIPPDERNHRITDLEKHTRYVINIAAVNEIGVGNYSDDIVGMTDEDVPSKPPNISGTFSTTSTSLRVAWEPLPQQFIHGRLLGYRVFYRPREAGNNNRWESTVVIANSLEANITGLRASMEYMVQVVGFTRKGNGPLSKSFSIRTDEDVPSKPPQNLTVAIDNSTSTSLFIRWHPVPEANQNGVVLGYRILYKKSHSQEELKENNVSAEVTATVLKNLSMYTEYNISILAYTSKGNGAHARFFTALTKEDRPTKPPILDKIFNTSSTSIMVSWSEIPQEHIHGILHGYVVLYRALNQSLDTYTDEEIAPNMRSVELTKLWKYTEYGIRVLGFTSVGWGVISREVVVRTDEDTPSWAPENVLVFNKTSPTMIPVSWQPISNSYYIHGILKGYIVSFTAVRNPNHELNEKEKNIVVGPNTLSVNIRNLTSFTVYSIQVRAFTEKGNGIPSSSIFAETCNCHSVLHTNWWLNPPYMDMHNDNATGIFPPILTLVVRSCCGECEEHGHTTINFPTSKDSETLVKEAIDDRTELSFPIYGRMEQTDYSNEYGFAPLVQSAGVAFIIPGAPPGAAALMVVRAVFDLWPLIVTMFISAFFAGIIMWLLDFLFNAQEFPSSPFRGPAEGMWWAFVTMTTLGYGDRVPRGAHSKVFALIWIICGLVITALVMSFITTSLTMDIIKSDATVYGSKVAAIEDSSEFRLGIRMNARMDQARRYRTLSDLYDSLSKRLVDGALVDVYTVGSRKELFSDGVLRMGKIIEYPSAYGVVMSGYARRLQKCFREFLKEEKATVFEVITKNVDGITGLQDSSAAEKTEDLFDIRYPIYVKTLIWCGGSICFLTVVFTVYELLTRKKRNPHPRRYDHVDYLEYKSRQDVLYDYNTSKEIMKKIVTDFHKNCRLRLENLKAKHHRELRLLARLKQEAAEKSESEPLNGNGRKFFQLGFGGRSSITKYTNGNVP